MIKQSVQLATTDKLLNFKRRPLAKLMTLTLSLVGYGLSNKRAYAQPLDCAAGSTVIINDAVENNIVCAPTAAVEIITNGSLTNGSTADLSISNSLSLGLNYTSFSSGAQALLTNSGLLSNSGSLESENSLVTNSGTLNNSGNLKSGAHLLESTLTNSGILNNNGTLSNYSKVNGTAHLSNTGTLTNNGGLLNESFADYGKNNPRFRPNGIGGNGSYGDFLVSTSTSTLSNLGTLINNGLVANRSYGDTDADFFGDGGTATLTNSGTLINGPSFGNGTLLNESHYGGTSILNNDGQLTNSGTLNNLSLGGNSILNNTGTLINALGASLNNYSKFNVNPILQNPAASASTLINSGTLINYGNIISGGYKSGASASDDTLYNAGTLVDHGGIFVGAFENSGALDISAGGVLGTSSFTQTGGSTNVDGNLVSTSAATVLDFQGGSLSGNGFIQSDIIIGENATVNPGNSPGILTVMGDVTLLGGLTIEVKNPMTFDQFAVAGTMDFGTGSFIDFSLDNSFKPTDGLELEFLTAGNIIGYDNLDFIFTGGMLDGFDWNIVLDEINFDLSINFSEQNFNSVPEPSTLALFSLGLPMLGWLQRRRRNSRANEPISTPRFS